MNSVLMAFLDQNSPRKCADSTAMYGSTSACVFTGETLAEWGSTHIPPYKSFDIRKSAHMLHPLDEIAQTLHALPKSFDAWFAIPFHAEEATEHGDLADDFTNCRDRHRRLPP